MIPKTEQLCKVVVEYVHIEISDVLNIQSCSPFICTIKVNQNKKNFF